MELASRPSEDAADGAGSRPSAEALRRVGREGHEEDTKERPQKIPIRDVANRADLR